MSNIDEAFREFSEMIDELSDLRSIAGNITQDLDNYAFGIRALAPQNLGRLRNSIQLLAATNGSNFEVTFEMVEYGLFQNFGVKPDAQSPIRRLRSTSAERTQPYVDEGYGGYSYSNRQFGLPATRFFDIQQLRDDVAGIIENEINNITQ